MKIQEPLTQAEKEFVEAHLDLFIQALKEDPDLRERVFTLYNFEDRPVDL